MYNRLKFVIDRSQQALSAQLGANPRPSQTSFFAWSKEGAMKKPVLIATVFFAVFLWLSPASANSYPFGGKVWGNETVDPDTWLPLTSKRYIQPPLFDQSKKHENLNEEHKDFSWKDNNGNQYGKIGRIKESYEAPFHAPEPSTWFLLTTGLVGLVIIRRRRFPGR